MSRIMRSAAVVLTMLQACVQLSIVPRLHCAKLEKTKRAW